MKANPGGQVAPDNVIGRDDLIRALWQTLEHQSVLLTAERRIGKTCVVQKMRAEAPGPWFPVYQEIEDVHTAEEFSLKVFGAVQQYLSGWRKTANRALKWLNDRGVKIVGVGELAAHPQGWKELLTRSIEDLVHEQAEQKLVFFWDEFPDMIDNILQRDGPATAREVLDVLRALRHTHSDFRMVLTGSIGLHHVLARLQLTGGTGAPINDVYQVEVTPLAPADAAELARRLIHGEALTTSDVDAAAECMAEASDYIPFYIHHLARVLRTSQRPAEPDRIEEVVAEQLVDANDPWELGHYRDRIPDYYRDDAALVVTILDELSQSDGPPAANELLNQLKAHPNPAGSIEPFDDRDRLLRVLRLMERDHYLKRTPENEYGFRFPLIGRWWKLDRGLE